MGDGYRWIWYGLLLCDMTIIWHIIGRRQPEMNIIEETLSLFLDDMKRTCKAYECIAFINASHQNHCTDEWFKKLFFELKKTATTVTVEYVQHNNSVQ